MSKIHDDGVEELSKSSYERILLSVESVLGRVQLLIEQEMKRDGILQPVYEDAFDRIKHWSDDVSDIKREHPSILEEWFEHNSEIDAKRMVHVDRIRRASSRPQQLNALLTFSDCYRSQINNEHISGELLFATRLIEALLKRVQLEISPIVVFSYGFYTYDAGDVCIFTIPYSFYKSYTRWVNLAHEVGHLVIRRKCHLDTKELGMVLMQRIIENTEDMEREKAEILLTIVMENLLLWLDRWADEIVSDCIAVFLCGIGYMNETIVQSFQDIFQGNPGSHPPTALRLACQIEVIERMGVDVTNLQQFRENIPQLSEDPSMKYLTDLNLTPLIVDWILEHECISNLKGSWQKIITAMMEYRDGKTPKVDIDIGFGALSFLTNEIPTKTNFEKLKNQI